MKYIKLGGKYGKDKFAIVDDEDFEKVNQLKWCLDKRYARHNINTPVYSHLLMHRFVINVPKGMETDHINGNRLDNRKSNLRIVTHQQNLWNTRKSINLSSMYKGVCFKKDHKKYKARITYNYRVYELGYFDKEEDAAIAYNQAAKEYFGEYAKLNKIGGGLDYA